MITKAAVEMISPLDGIAVIGKDNKVNYCDIVMAWLGNAGSGNSNNAIHRSPASATIIPFPAQTVKPTQTFSLVGPVVSQVDNTHNDGNQNIPPGPGEKNCERCDLSRLLTSTCCGIGGGVSNPMEIGAGVAIPRPLFLPPGFVPNQEVTSAGGTIFPAGKPLPREVLVPIGTIFPFPFIIPPGLPLSDTWSDSHDNGNNTLYLPDGFWDGSRTITCSFPCAIVFPPITTRSTWTPPPIPVRTKSTTTTTIIPPFTTGRIKVSRTVVSSKASQTIFPTPGPKPMCFKLPLLKIKLCPPAIQPFPPPVPPVVVIPVPPGGKPGPTTPDDEPTEDEKQEEEEEEEEKGTCALALDNGDDGAGGDDGGDDGGYDESYPGAGKDHQPDGYTDPGTGGGGGNPTGGGGGGGKPTVVTVTVTPTDWVTVTVQSTTTVNPYPFTQTWAWDDATTICASSSKLGGIGIPVTVCAGDRSTIYPHGSPAPKPTDPPKPAPTNGWYKCSDHRSEPEAESCDFIGSRHFPIISPVHDGWDEFCDKVDKWCHSKSKMESISKFTGLGMATFRWGRVEQSYHDDRDCPLDHANCVEFAKRVAYGPTAHPLGTTGADLAVCDASGERVVAVLVDVGTCIIP